MILTAAIALLLCAGPPRAGVEMRLAAMESAALAGDAPAWLACIAPGDSHFTTEQGRFADDLRDHPPLEFDLSIADDPPPVFAESRADCTLVMRYRAPFGHAAAGKTASWPAVFTFADPDGDGPRAADWVYQGENWLAMPADGFEVRYLPGAEQAASDIVRAFPIAKAHDDEGFEITNDKHQVIKLYNDMEHLKATVYLTMPDEVLGGWNESGESIKFMSSYSSGVEGWTGAMAHEYGHVATWELGPHASRLPWWVQEGAAELAAEAFFPGSRQRLDEMMRSMAAAGTLPSFDQISDYRTTEAPLKIMAYHQGHHLFGYISERWGRRERNRWLTMMARGATVDEATRAVLGMPFAELDAAWRGSLASGDPSEDPAAVRAVIAERLASMEAAVLAGDGPAYLVNIASGDPEFAAEQQHWADDLRQHVPEAFELALIGDAAVTGGSAEAELAMSWKMPGGAARKVEYPVRFVQAPGGAGWLYAGERWAVVKGEGVEALCAGGLEPAGQKVVEVFPAVRAHVQEGFELTVPRIQKVKLYDSMKHLQASIYLSYVDGLGGWNEPGESIKIVASRDLGGGFKTLLAHEFGHVCTFEMGPHAADMPWWALEGVAELSAERFAHGRGWTDEYVRNLAASDELGDWEAMSDFRNTPQRMYHLVYPQGHHMLGYISERFGRSARNLWLREMAQGKTIDEASRAVLGLGFDELDARWRESLAAKEPEPVPAGD